MEGLDRLLDEKELLAAQIDEVEIGLISARGGKLRELLGQLEELEVAKEALKAQIRRLQTQSLSHPSPPPARPPPALAGPAGGPAAAGHKPAGWKKGPAKKKGVPGGAVRPPKVASQGNPGRDAATAEELLRLENELTQLEAMVEAKEDEERRLRFEMESRKRDLYLEESAVYAREQKLLELQMANDPSLRHVVRVQRLFRASKVQRRWRNGKEPALRAIVERYRDSESAKPGKARWNLIMEIYTSQKQYLDSLLVARDKYVVPWQQASPEESGMTSDQCRQFFGNLSIICTFEQDIVEALRVRLFSRFVHPSIGDLILRLSSVFPLYVDYCRNVDDSFATLGRLQKSSNAFAEFGEKLFLASGSRVPLVSLLGLPAQRLFQYETILSALVQLTEASHSDLPSLRAALKAVTSAAAEVRQFQEERKLAQKLASALRRIKDLPANVARPGRQLLHEQDVTLLERKRVRQRLFLFDDLIVVAQAGSSKQLKFVEQIPLLGLRYHSLMDTDTVYNGFEIQTLSKLWVFVCDTYDAKCEFEAIMVPTLSHANSCSVDGLAAAGAGGSSGSSTHAGLSQQQSSSSGGAGFGLQRAGLQSEIFEMSENLSRLPSGTAEKLFASRFSGLILLLEDTVVLSRLARNSEALLAAVQVLDAQDKLASTVSLLVKQQLRGVRQESQLVSLLSSPDAVLVSFVAAAASFAAKDWLCTLVGPHAKELSSKGTGAEDSVLQLMSKDLLTALKKGPPFVAFASSSFSAAAEKHFRGAEKGGLESTWMFLVTAFVVPVLRSPSRYGVTGISEAAAGPLNAAASKLLSSPCPVSALPLSQSNVSLKPMHSLHQCEAEALPLILDYMVREVEDFRSPDHVCKALASAIVLKK